jgi:1-acyl-sn-glycerol-3-phosphate acyltransferase
MTTVLEPGTTLKPSTTLEPQAELDRADVHDVIDLLGQRDPASVQRYLDAVRPVLRHWFRADLRGIDQVPADGGVLLVGNHSGGVLTTDHALVLEATQQRFGPSRPVYTLVHDVLLRAPQVGPWLRRVGCLRASPESAALTLQAGLPTMVFPGGDHEATRPSWQSSRIDFKGRTGYVRMAIEAGVPIVPFVTYGAQHAQFFVSRGDVFVRALKLKQRFNSATFPLTVGFPFGLAPVNMPLPVKLSAQVLEPIDVRAECGDDVARADRLVRSRMQEALHRLASERRFRPF